MYAIYIVYQVQLNLYANNLSQFRCARMCNVQSTFQRSNVPPPLLLLRLLQQRHILDVAHIFDIFDIFDNDDTSPEQMEWASSGERALSSFAISCSDRARSQCRDMATNGGIGRPRTTIDAIHLYVRRPIRKHARTFVVCIMMGTGPCTKCTAFVLVGPTVGFANIDDNLLCIIS